MVETLYHAPSTEIDWHVKTGGCTIYTVSYSLTPDTWVHTVCMHKKTNKKENWPQMHWKYMKCILKYRITINKTKTRARRVRSKSKTFLYSVNQQICCNQWSVQVHSNTFRHSHTNTPSHSWSWRNSVLNTVNDLQLTDCLSSRSL